MFLANFLHFKNSEMKFWTYAPLILAIFFIFGCTSAAARCLHDKGNDTDNSIIQKPSTGTKAAIGLTTATPIGVPIASVSKPIESTTKVAAAALPTFNDELAQVRAPATEIIAKDFVKVDLPASNTSDVSSNSLMTPSHRLIIADVDIGKAARPIVLSFIQTLLEKKQNALHNFSTTTPSSTTSTTISTTSTTTTTTASPMTTTTTSTPSSTTESG